MLGACTIDAPSTAVGLREDAIVYGADDRRDVYETAPPFDQIAEKTAVALIAPSQLRELPSGDYALDVQSYGDLQMLCAGERFAEQPAAASCSGVLLTPDIVATAGHCLGVRSDGTADCANNRYVFGFGISIPDAPLAIKSTDVFDCKRMLGRVKSPAEAACRYDLVLIELDRPVPRALPATIRDRSVETNEPVVVVGFPAGLPVKTDRGARVVDARSAQGDYFTLNSDTFAVSSGSGVFDSTGQLVGLFARGRRDYDQAEGCQRVHREDENDAPGYEEATQIGPVQSLLHAITWAEPLRPSTLTTCSATTYAELTPAAVANGCSVGGVGTPGAALHLGWPVLLIGLRRRSRSSFRVS